MSDRKEGSSRNSGAGQDRNRRMLAGIQSHLGGGTPLRSGGTVTTRDRRKAKEPEPEPVEELNDLDSIIAQISDLSVRSDRSAIQIKRNITSSKYLEQMDEDDWDELCDTLVNLGMEGTETDFVVDLFSTLMSHELFCEVMSGKLMAVSSSFIMIGDGQENIAHFIGSILCANWPRSMSKAIDRVNPILFTSMCIVKGWLLVLDEDFQAGSSMKKQIPETVKTTADDSEDGEDEEDDEKEENKEEGLGEEGCDEKEKEIVKEEPEVINRCAIAVSQLCGSTQRSLWMKHPELCDEIYQSIKPAITHSSTITGTVKSELLSTLLLLNNWTKSRVVTTKSSMTQTVGV